MKKKQRLGIDELNAYKTAYGRPIAKEDYAVNVVLPACFGGTLVVLLLNTWWLACLVGVVYAIYGYRVLLSQNIQRFYLHKAFDQRNRFMNNLTQLLADPSLSWFVALQRASERCEGEFRADLDQLLVHVQEASAHELGAFFRTFSAKYAKDVVFTLFVEQLETIALEGRTNIDMIRDIKTYHNQLRERTKHFVARKKRVIDQLKLYLLMSGGIVGLFHVFPLGFANYLHSFAYTPIGWVTSGLYMGALTWALHKSCVYFYDDEVMEVTL